MSPCCSCRRFRTNFHRAEDDPRILQREGATLRGVDGLVFVAYGNCFANELGRRSCVTGEIWKDKPPFRLSFGSASIALDAES